MLSFLRIQIEVREEGRPGRTPSAFSRLLPEEDVEPPTAPMGHLPTASALAAESVPVTEEVCPLCSSCQHTIADCNVQLPAEEKRARLRTARCCYRCGLQTTSRVFADVRAASSVVSATDDISLSSVNCHAGSPNPCKRNDSEPRRASHRRARHEHAVSDIGSKRPERNQRRSSPNRTSLDRVRPREVIRSRRVALTLRGQRRDIVVTVEALEVPEVCAVTSPPLSTDILQLLCDKNYDAADNFHPDTWNPQEVSVLLGSDVYWKGTTERERSSASTSALFLHCSTKSVPDCDLSAMWRLDVIGIKAPAQEKSKVPPELEAFEEGIVKLDGRYQVPADVKGSRNTCRQRHSMVAERRLQAPIK
ncbi:hypothetical protein HPB52_023088 [Rhipicephalus sanguineus]|uniref:Uncharacterized protein n=1 Tax=Rhipicephalus sanguineus TaxID=34632 RepID=A0A9D4Q8P1_RHISA|nr:hypothetical protein HPB52_023088 [Rhipicephalus sanguineus]